MNTAPDRLADVARDIAAARVAISSLRDAIDEGLSALGGPDLEKSRGASSLRKCLGVVERIDGALKRIAEAEARGRPVWLRN